MKTPKIDFVITWVDGSDPVWDMQRQETLRKQGIFVDESLDNSTARYRDWDILKYWFRGYVWLVCIILKKLQKLIFV